MVALISRSRAAFVWHRGLTHVRHSPTPAARAASAAASPDRTHAAMPTPSYAAPASARVGGSAARAAATRSTWPDAVLRQPAAPPGHRRRQRRRQRRAPSSAAARARTVPIRSASGRCSSASLAVSSQRRPHQDRAGPSWHRCGHLRREERRRLHRVALRSPAPGSRRAPAARCRPAGRASPAPRSRSPARRWPPKPPRRTPPSSRAAGARRARASTTASASRSTASRVEPVVRRPARAGTGECARTVVPSRSRAPDASATAATSRLSPPWTVAKTGAPAGRGAPARAARTAAASVCSRWAGRVQAGHGRGQGEVVGAARRTPRPAAGPPAADDVRRRTGARPAARPRCPRPARAAGAPVSSSCRSTVQTVERWTDRPARRAASRPGSAAAHRRRRCAAGTRAGWTSHRPARPAGRGRSRRRHPPSSVHEERLGARLHRRPASAPVRSLPPRRGERSTISTSTGALPPAPEAGGLPRARPCLHRSPRSAPAYRTAPGLDLVGRVAVR